MPYNAPRGNTSAPVKGWQLPHTRGFAILILGALALLFILRFFYGNISVEAGTR